MKLTGISVLRGEGGGLYKPKAFTKEVWQYVSVILLDRVKRYLTFNLIHVNSGYKSVCETAPKFLFWAPSCVPGFEYMPQLACWKSIGDLPITMKANSKCTSGNLLSPLVAQNKHIGSALQMLLTEDKLHRSATKATCYTACILTNYAPLIMPPGAVLHLFSGVLLRQVFSCCQWSLYQVSSSQEPAQRLFRLKLLAIHQEYLLYVSHFHYQFQLQEL